jgi:hypothetical protein
LPAANDVIEIMMFPKEMMLALPSVLGKHYIIAPKRGNIMMRSITSHR